MEKLHIFVVGVKALGEMKKMAKRKTGNDTIARQETLRHQKLIIKKRREKK